VEGELDVDVCACLRMGLGYLYSGEMGALRQGNEGSSLGHFDGGQVLATSNALDSDAGWMVEDSQLGPATCEA